MHEIITLVPFSNIADKITVERSIRNTLRRLTNYHFPDFRITTYEKGIKEMIKSFRG